MNGGRVMLGGRHIAFVFSIQVFRSLNVETVKVPLFVVATLFVWDVSLASPRKAASHVFAWER